MLIGARCRSFPEASPWHSRCSRQYRAAQTKAYDARLSQSAEATAEAAAPANTRKTRPMKIKNTSIKAGGGNPKEEQKK
jgi:hypothetical protein